MTGRGRPILEAWEQRLLDDREAIIVTARCAWCAWHLAGDVKTTREAHRDHRATVHPDITVAERRKRRRPARQFNSAKNLDDNIAGARAQGAAGWAEPK